MNICNCADPPGGRVECPDDLMPMCIVTETGEKIARCVGRPVVARVNRVAFFNWALFEVTGRKRPRSRPLSNTDEEILASGEYIRSNGDKVTFRLPPPPPRRA